MEEEEEEEEEEEAVATEGRTNDVRRRPRL